MAKIPNVANHRSLTKQMFFPISEYLLGKAPMVYRIMRTPTSAG